MYQGLDDEKASLADEYYQKGLIHFHKGLYKEAIIEFDRAVEINQLHQSVYKERGMAYGYLGDHEKAVSDFTKAIDLDSGQPAAYAAYTMRGVELTRLGKYTEAIADFTAALDMFPASFQLLVLRAMAYFDSGDYARAIRDYGWAIEINKDATVYVRRANVHSMRSMYELADNDYSFAIKIKPDFADAYLGRGLIYCREGLIEQGFVDLRKFLELTSSSNGYADARKYVNSLLAPSQEQNVKGWCVDCLQIHLKNFDFPSCTLEIQVPGLKSFTLTYPSEEGTVVALSGRQFVAFVKDQKVVLDYFTPEVLDVTIRYDNKSLTKNLKPLYQLATPNGQDKLPFCKIGIVEFDFQVQ